MNGVEAKSTENRTCRAVYGGPTRTVPRPIMRRFGPSMTVVGPGAGLATALGTARGIALAACVAGVASLLVAILAGNLRKAIGPSCVRVTVDPPLAPTCIKSTCATL